MQGRVVEETQNGHVLRHTYDLFSGRRQLLELPSGAETQCHYGPLGQLLSAQLSDHEPLRFSYDERGQEISRHTQSGFQLQQQWDVLGQLQQQFSSDYSALHPAAPRVQRTIIMMRRLTLRPVLSKAAQMTSVMSSPFAIG